MIRSASSNFQFTKKCLSRKRSETFGRSFSWNSGFWMINPFQTFMECQPAGFGCQACWEHLQTDGERRKDTFNKHTDDRSNNTRGRQTKHKQKKRRHIKKKKNFFTKMIFFLTELLLMLLTNKNSCLTIRETQLGS